MKRSALALTAVTVMMFLAVAAGARDQGAAAQSKPVPPAKATAARGEAGMNLRPVVQTPEWQKLRSLVGEWAGSVEMDGKKIPTSVEVRMTGDGSAVMHIAGKDTPYEMVTMFHADGDRLLATHYCGAHNQPRMALVKGSAPNQMAFEFVDGTNIQPGDTHMSRLVLTLTDADHHDEAWTSATSGKETPAMVFSYTRKK
jgi:hypothetical protein